jgi:superfamily II DNA/RNA helicase
MIVFDEADKMLEMGFEAEVKQIMSHTHSEVQTVLFSATISKEVGKLTAITSKKPIRVSADPDHVNN